MCYDVRLTLTSNFALLHVHRSHHHKRKNGKSKKGEDDTVDSDDGLHVRYVSKDVIRCYEVQHITSKITIRNAHLNTCDRNQKKTKGNPTSATKKGKSKGKETDDSDDDENGKPKDEKKTQAKLKDSYVLQVAVLATLEGLCKPNPSKRERKRERIGLR
jgi:hypothetical protein